MDDRTKLMLLAIRAALIQLLGRIEDALELPRTAPTRQARRSERPIVRS